MKPAVRNTVIILMVAAVAACCAYVFLGGSKPQDSKTPQAKSASQTRIAENSAFKVMAEADANIADGNLNKGRELLEEVVSNYTGTNAASEAQLKLDETGLEFYFSSLDSENSEEYEVKPGDSLARIARRYNTTVGTIKAANNLTKDTIWPYQKLTVPLKPWSMLVDKSRNILTLRAGSSIVRNYAVATGSENSTPVGEFKVINRLVNPTWYYEGKIVPPGDPENPLGTRWLGFDIESYGLHGTTDPESIGDYATLGCVRMLNEEIEELFELIPVGTIVKIIE